MRIDLDNGKRPYWMRDEDTITARYYHYDPATPSRSRSFATGKNSKGGLEFRWGMDLAAVEIEGTHPYAVAATQGFTYNPGRLRTPPSDLDPTLPILFGDNSTTPHAYNAGCWEWLDKADDIIGYNGRGYCLVGDEHTQPNAEADDILNAMRAAALF